MAWQAFDDEIPLESPVVARGPSEYPELESIAVWIVQLAPDGTVAAAAAGVGTPTMTLDPEGGEANVWSLPLRNIAQAAPLAPGPARGFAIAQPRGGPTRTWFKDIRLTPGCADGADAAAAS
jgi:hypothetical protein